MMHMSSKIYDYVTFRDKKIQRCAFKDTPPTTSCYRPKGIIFIHFCTPARLLEHVVTKSVCIELLFFLLDNRRGNSLFVAENVRYFPTEMDSGVKSVTTNPSLSQCGRRAI